MSTSATASETPAKGKRLALVIGVNQAPDSYLPPLQHAITDTEAMAQALKQYGKFELVGPPLLGEHATSAAVKKAILRLMRDRTDDDVLLLYFSGHGLPMTVEKEDQPGVDLVYLVTSDFCERDVEDAPDLHLSMRWLRDNFFISTKAGRVLVILDCCFAGDYARTGPTIQLKELIQQIAYYFDLPGTARGARPGGLRQALTATGHNQPTEEKDEHGLMTGPLLRALRGEVETVLGQNGQNTLNLLYDYLYGVMPPGQKPSLSGDSAARDYILAWHLERAAERQKRQKQRVVNERPRDYIPFPRNQLFQPRPGEFEHLETLLFGAGKDQQPIRLGLVGVVGLGGVGKTQLAVEFAYRYQERFPAGIFWMRATGTTSSTWQRRLAKLAINTNYLPSDDDPSNPSSRENQTRRANHFCRYLADHRDALLILDNVKNPNLVVSVLPSLAGKNIACTIIYTSRNRFAPQGATIYTVEQLLEVAALRLLLETTRQSLLAEFLAGSQESEALAAPQICRGVGYLPLALVHLRGLLGRDSQLTLVRLAEVLKQRGALELAKTQQGDAAPLFATFSLSWQEVRDEATRRLFKLATFFPESAPIPLRLLGLATGLGERADILEPLGEACVQLRELSLLEELSSEQVRLHPLVREFGRRLVTEDGERGRALQQEAGERLLPEFTAQFTDLSQLEKLAYQRGYWTCLEQVRAGYAYAKGLGSAGQLELIRCIERWLDRESYLLADEHWWPATIPGLFYQQLFNRSVEEGYKLTTRETPSRWVKLTAPVGAEDRSLVRIFAGHSDSVASVAFSPDGKQILTGSSDRTARLWDRDGGEPLVIYGHSSSVTSVAFSPDGKQILIGSSDSTAQLWERDSGQLLTSYQGCTKWVTSITFSSDGKQVLAGSSDGTARLWNRESGEQLVHYQGHTSSVTKVAFSSNGQFVITCDFHGRIFFWQGQGHDRGRLLGIYVTTYEIGAIYWQDATHMILADKGGPTGRPHFYRLSLEGEW